MNITLMVFNIIASITTMLNALDCVDLKITNKANNVDVLRLVVGNEYELVGDKYALTTSPFLYVSTTLISTEDQKPLELGMDLNDILNFVNTIIAGTAEKGGYAPDDDHRTDPYTPSVNPPESDLSTAEDDATTKLLKTIGGYLLGAYIGIKDGEHGDIFAKFDTADTATGLIPFSWYT